MKTFLTILCLAVFLHSAQAEAQMGRLLKEGIEAAGKKAFGRSAAEAAQEGSEQLLKKAGSAAIREATQESAEALAKGVGSFAVRHSDDAVRAIRMHGSAIVTPIIKNFGDDGAKAMAKLSPTSARRMAMLSEELATGGRGADWMRVLAAKGDIAAEWIWKNKGTITIATAATAFLANPEPFLVAGETVASKSIETAGRHVARPLIEQTVKETGKIVTQPAVALIEAGGRHPWMWLALGTVVLGGGFAAYRLNIRPWLRLFGRR